MDIIKKNTSSPFHLQRSIVPQGDEDGAYSKGGYNPEAVYSNDAANQAMESFSKTIGTMLSNADFSKKKKPANEEVKKEKAKEIVSSAMNNAFDPFGIEKVKKHGSNVRNAVENIFDPMGVKKSIRTSEENKRILSNFSKYQDRGI